MATATLQAIRDKIRRLTRSPSVNQITDAQIDEYVNTFIAFDLPEHLRLFSLHEKVVFSLEPNKDTYTVTEVLTDVNSYVTFNPPVYIAGNKALFSQSEDEFYNLYPFVYTIVDTDSTGNGASVSFSGTLDSVPVLKGKVALTSIDVNGDGLIVSDDHDNGASGTLTGDGTGTINYTTGAWTVTYSVAPASGEAIVAQTVPYQAAKPVAILYFNNSFTVRPVPDQVYQVQIETFRQPTELLSASSTPELEQWWQYIAYGAAKKVFEDRMDLESVQMIMPEFKKQERLVLRRTIVQQTNERTATIYTEMVNNNTYWNQR